MIERRHSIAGDRRWQGPRPKPLGRAWKALVVVSVLAVAVCLLGMGGAFDGWLS